MASLPRPRNSLELDPDAPPSFSRRSFIGGVLASGVSAACFGSLGRARADGGPSGRSVGVAVVGLGKLSLNEILPALTQTSLCHLAAVVSGHPEKAARVAEQYGLPSKNILTYETYDRIAENRDVEIVYVVLPNSMHAEYSIRASRAGKHVLCEKPMAVSSLECDQMITAARASGRQLAVGYRLRFEPYNGELIRLARERELGPIKVIDTAAGFAMGPDVGQWRLNKKLAGGGSLMDMGIYALQAARYISGEEPTSVSAQQTITDAAKFRGIDETIVFTLKFPSGVVAKCTSSYATVVNRFEVAAEGGRFGLDPAQWYRGIKGFRSDGKPFQFPDVNHFVAELDDFASCVRTGLPSRVPGEEGLRDLRLIEAIYRSAETAREIRLV
ncbi:MAG TPA: Gfo/Idh/MocA family oxidoreductase [Polyangiaceae bacterium]|nr:Gfo/Idh/MocA family oxidoreductase [Polyangiaceae bacterium]